MSHHNSNIPKDYNPAPDGMHAPTFTAPAHNLNSQQAEAVVELAESSHNDTGATSHTTTGSGLTGSSGVGSGLGSSSGHGLSSHSTSGSGLTGSNHGTGAGVGAGALGTGAAALSGRDTNNPDREITSGQQDTRNKAPHLATESREHQNEINAVPGVGDAAPKMGHAKPGGEGKGSFPTTSGASGTDFKDEKLRQTEHSEYPEQRHAGKVGLGPNISTGTSITDKIKGVLGHHHTHEDHVKAHEEDQASQNPLNNPVKGQTGLTGNQGHMNPDDSKGMASKRLGEDSTTLGSR